MLLSSAFYECITGSTLIGLQESNMAKKKTNVVRITTQFDLMVSDEFLQKLQKTPLEWIILENCFRTNGMNVINANMEVLKDETV